MIVRYTALVFGVVEMIRHVDEDGGVDADHFVTVRDTGRDQQLPGTKMAEIESVTASMRRRARAQVDKSDLQHARHRRPVVGLVFMDVKRLDGARIAHRRGNLSAGCRKLACGTTAHAQNLEERAAIVGPQGALLHAHAVDQVGRIRLQDDVSDALLLTSVISSSPRFDGTSVFTLSNTVSSYM